MFSRFAPFIPVLALAFAPGCAHIGNEVELAMRDGEPDVLLVESDTELRAAAEQARNSVDKFLMALVDPGPEQDRFAIKVPVTQGDDVEHVWLTDVVQDGTSLVGRLDNTLYLDTDLKAGDRIAVQPRGITDWMYVDAGRVVGAFTTRVLYARESEPDRQRVRDMTGLDFGSI